MAGIGVFGGTFNPPHMGHLRLVRRFADRLSLSKVIIIPTNLPPHKMVQELASGEDRAAMCRLLFEGDPRFVVSTMELERKGKSYTYDTLCALKEQYPDEKLYFIVGSDMLLSFDSWYRAQDILKLCTLCAASRDGEFDIAIAARENVITDSIEPLEISSTQIREMVKENLSVARFVGEETEKYIRKKGLYNGQ